MAYNMPDATESKSDVYVFKYGFSELIKAYVSKLN